MDLRAQHGGKDNESPHLLQPTRFRGLLPGNLLKPDYYPTPIKAKEKRTAQLATHFNLNLLTKLLISSDSYIQPRVGVGLNITQQSTVGHFV